MGIIFKEAEKSWAESEDHEKYEDDEDDENDDEVDNEGDEDHPPPPHPPSHHHPPPPHHHPSHCHHRQDRIRFVIYHPRVLDVFSITCFSTFFVTFNICYWFIADYTV